SPCRSHRRPQLILFPECDTVSDQINDVSTSIRSPMSTFHFFSVPSRSADLNFIVILADSSIQCPARLFHLWWHGRCSEKCLKSVLPRRRDACYESATTRE